MPHAIHYFFFFLEMTTVSHVVNSELYAYILHNIHFFNVYINQLPMQSNNQSIRIVLIHEALWRILARRAGRLWGTSWARLEMIVLGTQEQRASWEMSCVQWGKPHTVEWGVPSEGGMRKGERTWGHKYLVPPDGISFHPSVGWFWEPPPRLLCFTRFRWVLCWAIGIATSACPMSTCGGKMECLHHVHETL